MKPLISKFWKALLLAPFCFRWNCHYVLVICILTSHSRLSLQQFKTFWTVSGYNRAVSYLRSSPHPTWKHQVCGNRSTCIRKSSSHVMRRAQPCRPVFLHDEFVLKQQKTFKFELCVEWKRSNERSRDKTHKFCQLSGAVSKTSWSISGMISGLPPANERRRYFVTTSLIGWSQA